MTDGAQWWSSMDSGVICSSCGKNIELLDEIVLLQVVVPGYDAYKRQEAYIVEEDGDYKFPPQFFHMDCWTDLMDGLDEHLEDQEPFLDEGDSGQSYDECAVCPTFIRTGETSGMTTVGELQQSRRVPSGKPLVTFQPHPTVESSLICIACLVTFNEDLFAMWDDPPPTHANACPTGVQWRCWRDGGCTFGCRHRQNTG